MKIIKKVFLTMLAFALLFSFTANAQEETKEEVYEPVFLTVTTLHRTSNPDVDLSDWKETEKEFFDKVTSKNELIIGSGFYLHYFTSDDTEVISVSVYKSWSDIEAANDRTNDLIDEGWPNEDERDAFFKKQASYYDAMHSDEIYSSTRFGKDLVTESKEPLIYYVKKNIRGDGSGKGFKEYFENVTLKNDIVKGYYTHMHRYGANSREFNEVFVFESFGDIEKAFDEDTRLVKEHWPYEDKRKEFFKGYGNIFASHGDFIYQNVPELAK